MSLSPNINSEMLSSAFNDISNSNSNYILNATVLNNLTDKGELLVGNGLGPDYLDPSTGINDNVLTKYDSESLGVKWDRFPNSEKESLVISSSIKTFNLTQEMTGKNIIYSGPVNGKINLPILPLNSTTYTIIGTLPYLTYGHTINPKGGAKIRSANNITSTSYKVGSENRFDIIYNLSSNNWHTFNLNGPIT